MKNTLNNHLIIYSHEKWCVFQQLLLPCQPYKDEKGEVRVEVKVCSTAAAEVKAKK